MKQQVENIQNVHDGDRESFEQYAREIKTDMQSLLNSNNQLRDRCGKDENKGKLHDCVETLFKTVKRHEDYSGINERRLNKKVLKLVF